MNNSYIFNADIMQSKEGSCCCQCTRFVRNIHEQFVSLLHKSNCLIRYTVPVISRIFKILVNIGDVLSVKSICHLLQIFNGLKKQNITVNRKMLADLAVNDPAAFAKLVEMAKA